MELKKEKEVVDLLITFLKRATGDNATSNEIAVVPQVAKVLLDYSTSTLSSK